jgi:hypothetical protein
MISVCNTQEISHQVQQEALVVRLEGAGLVQKPFVKVADFHAESSRNAV